MADLPRKRRRLRIIVPAFPAFNIYSQIARKTTALGPVCVATAVHEIEGWDAEVIDENNLGRYGPRSPEGGADHEILQGQRPADVSGLRRIDQHGPSTSWPGSTNNGGPSQSRADNTSRAKCREALHSVDYVVFGEGEKTIRALQVVEGRREASRIRESPT
jgi:hypothetical protein